MGDPTTDWELLLWDVSGPAPPAVPARLRVRAALRAARGLRALRRRGWGHAHRWLREQAPARGAAAALGPLPPPLAIRLARQELPYCQAVARVVEPNALCLPRSFALAVYLSALGLPAQVVVGRQRTHTSSRFAFHAWTELHGEVVNDIPGVQTGYTVLQRCSGIPLA